MIQAMGSIKKRPHPDKIAHHSVGTIAELSERTEKLSSLSEFKLLASHLESLILSRDDMVMWEYVVDAPPGLGGDRPSEVGNAVKCERCNSQFIVSSTPRPDECTYHWGRAYGTKVNGTKRASRPSLDLSPNRRSSSCSQVFVKPYTNAVPCLLGLLDARRALMCSMRSS